MNNTNSQRCRSCLARGCKLKPLSGFSKASENALHMSDVFMMCAAIQIAPNDGFSQYACIKCIESAEKAYLFKKQCEHSDKVWNEFKKRLQKDTRSNSVEALPRNDNPEITVPIPTLVKNECEADEYQVDNDPMSETEFVEIDDEMDNEIWNKFKWRLQKDSISTLVEVLPSNNNAEIIVPIPTPVKNECEADEYQVDNDPMTETGSVEIDDEMDNDSDVKSIEIHEEPKTENFTCKYCLTIFVDEAKLLMHELAHTIEPKKSIVKKYAIYGCRECSVDCKTAEEFVEHCHHLHKESIETLYYRCQLGGGDFANLVRFAAHVSKKHQKKKKFQCQLCDKEYKSRDALMYHIRRLHGDSKLPQSTWPRLCNYCDFSLNSQTERSTHLNQEHSDLKTSRCNKCGKTFFHKRALKIHAVSHDEPTRFMCQYCGKSFTSPSTLKAHIRIHTGEKPFKCDKCDASYAHKPSLRSHQLTHVEEKNFECKECHKLFLRPTTLRRHMATHTGSPKHPCHLCPQVLKNSTSLKRHLMIHSGESYCVCKVCGKGFNSVGNLKEHMRTHGKRRHFCMICNKEFSQERWLWSHNAKFHNEESS